MRLSLNTFFKKQPGYIYGATFPRKSYAHKVFEILLRYCDFLLYNSSLSTLSLPPNHLIHYPYVALDDFDDFGRDILVDIVGNGKAVISVLAEPNGGVDGLEQGFLVNAGDDEVAFVDGLGTFRAGANADGGEGMAYTGEETAFLGEGAAVADYGEGVHLEAVVVVETEGLMLEDSFIEFEAAGGKTIARTRVTAIEDRHIVFLCHFVDGAEEGQKVFLSVDVLFTMG